MANSQFSKEWFAAHLARAEKRQADLFHFMNERFGLDRTKVNKMVNGTRRPQPNELPALMEWLGLSLAGSVERPQALPPAAKAEPDVTIGETTNFPRVGPRDVPVRQVVTGGDDGEFTFTDEAIDYLRRPPSLSGQAVIGAYVTGDSMVPKYDPGEPVYAYAGRPAHPGDHVIIEMLPKEEGGERRGFIKKLVRRTSKSVTCWQYNPAREVAYPASEVIKVYRIVPNSELLS